MGWRTASRAGAVVIGVLGVAACTPFANRALKNYEPEAFGASMYTRHYLSTPAEACEAARRALLSQGYVVDKATAEQVSARKYFQPDTTHHVQMEFGVTCAPDGPDYSVVFASGTEDQYVARAASNSASVGVPVFGSLSLPLKGGLDSMVKIGSKTVTNEAIYDSLFALIGGYLKSVESEVRAGKPIQAEQDRSAAETGGANSAPPQTHAAPAP